MILTIRDELIIIFYLICYGVFVIAVYDLFLFFLPYRKMKKYLIYIFEALFWILMIIITYLFSYRLHDGYIPLYYAMFLLIGVVLYWYFFKKAMLEGALYIKKFLKICKKPLKKTLTFLFIPKETLGYLKRPFKAMKQTMVSFWKTLFSKKVIEEEGEEDKLLEFATEQEKDISLHV